jgi:hypothetical protein
MNELTILEHQNARVLTTRALAEQYGTDSAVISKNFTRNRERYIEGKHYHCLEGEEKRDFLNRHQIDDGSVNAKTFYLWTERGALLHAKSLNTDKAWEVYDRLVETYFRVRALKSVPTDKTERLRIMELNARTRKAKLLYQMTHVDTLSAEYKNILVAKAAEIALGEPLLPPVKSEQKTLTATQLAQMFGVTAQKIGLVTNQNNLKIEEYGEWYRDKSRHSAKEVDSFRYFDSVIPRLEEIFGRKALQIA